MDISMKIKSPRTTDIVKRIRPMDIMADILAALLGSECSHIMNGSLERLPQLSFPLLLEGPRPMDEG
jgi:hypothetical protein